MKVITEVHTLELTRDELLEIAFLAKIFLLRQSETLDMPFEEFEERYIETMALLRDINGILGKTRSQEQGLRDIKNNLEYR